MHDKLVRYLLDPTGTNPDNLVKNENHLLSDYRVRAIAPLYGAFFSDSVSIYDNINKKYLVKDIDYCSAGLIQDITLKIGKSINSIILILNTEISNNVSITYQVLGDYYLFNNPGLYQLLKQKIPHEINKRFNDIENLPHEFKPSFHLHDIGDIYQFDYIVFLLEKIRYALYWEQYDYIKDISDKVDRYIDNLFKDCLKFSEDYFRILLLNFKNSFNKLKYQLDKLRNYPTISLDEIESIFNDTNYNRKEEAYFSLIGLVKYVELLYSYGVSSGKTYLGKFHGTILQPNLNNLAKALNGTVFLLDYYVLVDKNSDTFNPEVYPNIENERTQWSIKKISNNLEDRGGIFLATSLSDLSTYVGKLTINPDNSLKMEWKRLLNQLDIKVFEEIESHINDHSNPHNDHKSKIELGSVENLPIADREDVVCNVPVRKYITLDLLMLFMKRFMTGEKDTKDIDLVEEEINTTRRMQMIFSPCNICDTRKDEWKLVEECKIANPPNKIYLANIDSDKIITTTKNDFIRIFAILAGFDQMTEVIIKLYRSVFNNKKQQHSEFELVKTINSKVNFLGELKVEIHQDFNKDFDNPSDRYYYFTVFDKNKPNDELIRTQEYKLSHFTSTQKVTHTLHLSGTIKENTTLIKKPKSLRLIGTVMNNDTRLFKPATTLKLTGLVKDDK